MGQKLEKATTVDIVFSCILPFWGVFVAIMAALKGEYARAKTMAVAALAATGFWFLVGFISGGHFSDK